jgi:DNA-binding CsgD family transcriptional regulator/PAS domain-containing protein
MNIPALKRIINPDILFETIQKYWTNYVEKEYGLTPTDYFIDTELIDKMSEDSYKLYAIIDLVKFKIDYIGKNAEELTGYTHQEFMDKGLWLFIQMLPTAQLSFFWNILNWTKKVHQKYALEFFKSYLSYCVFGLKIQHKSGEMMTIFIRAYGVQKNEDGTFMKIAVEVTNVTNLAKSKGYWAHYTIGENKKETMCFFSEYSSDISKSLITPRELEILKFVAIGRSSKEIGEQLFISISTVEKHRKNMIARVGAVDTLALVEICRRCGII